MSYGVSGPLQAAIYQTLLADSALAALVGGAIYDSVPPGDVPETYVSLGAEDVRDRSDKTAAGALHFITLSVISSRAGFSHAKAVAGAISDALIDAPLSLSRGNLVSLLFDRATARRVGTAETQRIDLRFRVRVDDN